MFSYFIEEFTINIIDDDIKLYIIATIICANYIYYVITVSNQIAGYLKISIFSIANVQKE